VVRNYWVIVGFGAGLLLGIVVARKIATGPATTELVISAPPAMPAPRQQIETTSTTGTHDVAPPPASQAASRVPAAANTAPPGPAEPAGPGLATVPVKAASSPYEPSIDSGVVQAIDVGEVLAKQVARPSQPGFENPIGDAHRELEREPRDEQWAYAMEGELQNSLVSQASMGEFKVEHVECRATLCEVRLSGRADQQAQLRAWSESLSSTGLGQRLFANMSSSVANDQRVDALYIFRRPRRQP
jgi:hypothetical protein